MKRRWIILSMFIAVFFVGFRVIHWANHPSSTAKSKSTDTDVLASTSELTPYTSTYFSTQIPADMQLKTSNENPRSAIRASYLFMSTRTSPSNQAAITVGTMGLNSLSEIPGVKQRLGDSATYQPVTVANAPEGAMSFKRTDDYQTAVFWKQGSLYVAVVVSGSSLHQAELDAALQSILTNWSWH